MNSSVISWISQQTPFQLYPNIQCRQITTGMESSMLMDDERDFMDYFDHEDMASIFGQDIHKYMSPAPSISVLESSSTLIDSNPSMQQHIIPNEFSTVDNHDDQPPTIPDFANQRPSENVQQTNPMRLETAMVVQPTKKKRIRPPSKTYDHIIAERRRREQLSQLFVALSALIPGLKKMDKSSILEDAIKHMKLLQERVKMLEDKAERKDMESVIIVRKSQVVVDDDDEECCIEQSSSFEQQCCLPEIGARVCDKQILLKVHCEKQNDVLVNLICKVESLNMSVVSTNATPFGNVSLDITLVAEMEKEFNMTIKEVLIALRAALQPSA